MMFVKRSIALAPLALASLEFSASAGSPPAVQPPYDRTYQINQIQSADGTSFQSIGASSGYASIAFAPGDPNTLLFSGTSYNTEAMLYSIGLTRDANQHITGFVSNAVAPLAVPGLGPTLEYGPHQVLRFYTAVNNNQLGMIAPSSTLPAKVIDLSALTPTAIDGPGPLAFVPQGMPGSNSLKIASEAGELYNVSLTPDGHGAFDISVVQDIATLAGFGVIDGNTNEPTGLAYVAAGNPHFRKPTLLTSGCDFNTGADSNVVAYQIDSNGNPILSTQSIVVTNLCATAMVVDPLTGDVLFSTFYGFPDLFALTGFTTSPTRFTAAVDADPSTTYTSNTITLSGIGANNALSIGPAGTYSKNGGTYTNAPDTVADGDTLSIQLGSSASFHTQVVADLKIGGRPNFFEVTTRGPDTTPDAFSFSPVVGVAFPNSVQTSNTITVSGLEPGYTGTPISISGGQYSFDGTTYNSDPGTVQNGQSVTVRLTASSSTDTRTVARLRIGTVTEPFSVTTAPHFVTTVPLGPTSR
jgi:hypothetical protein